METKMKIIWTCCGAIYDERIVPADEVAVTIGTLLMGDWCCFGQHRDKIEVYEVE
jgi:hypothetical protein